MLIHVECSEQGLVPGVTWIFAVINVVIRTQWMKRMGGLLLLIREMACMHKALFYFLLFSLSHVII